VRFNLDPVLIVALLLLLAWQVRIRSRDAAPRAGRDCLYAALGWFIAAAALISPLCALSVALFSARVTQHMLLILAAAPLIARALPRGPIAGTWPTWLSAGLFFAFLWIWHMPIPYEATFESPIAYWIMHVTLFGSGVLLWRELLHHCPVHTPQALTVGMLTFMHMGLLGAVLSLARHPMYWSHLLTTEAWGLTPLQDQQLGGAIMWVPGIALFLWLALRSIGYLWQSVEPTRAA
jgi:putative membrane protein